MLADQPFLTAAVVARVRAAPGPAARAVYARRARPSGRAPPRAAGARRRAARRPRLPRAARERGDGGRVRRPRGPARHRHACDLEVVRTVKLEQSFEVDAPVEQVWTALIDLEKVAPCLPGAAITGHDDDGTYHGEFQVKLGPTTASYRGTIRIESADAETHTATLAARGSDKRGQGGASATIVNSLHATDARRHARRRRDRLHDHRAARVVRARRDDQGHLEPAAARLRRPACSSGSRRSPPAG